MYVNRIAIGGFESDYYWSSSESGDLNAWVQSLSGGFRGNDFKGATFYVRPVRAF
jgi:hypothetical protein